MRSVLFLVVLVVLAGCTALPVPGGTDGTTADSAPETVAAETTRSPDSTSSTDRPGRDGTTTPAPEETTRQRTVGTTTTPTAETTDEAGAGSADNPWDEATLSVALVRNGHAETNYTTALRSALEYWNGHGVFADYPVRFELTRGDPADADIRVEIRESVGACGYDRNETAVGCAPLIERGTTPRRPAAVRIEAGFNQRSTRAIMIHEFGHVLGIEHGEPPEGYMTAKRTFMTVERPDVSDRAYPWQTSEFRVYVDTNALPAGERAATREQVGHAVEYYNRIRDEDPAVPNNVTLRIVDSPAAANVYVSFPDRLSCGSEAASCVGYRGPDLDGDLEIDYYNRMNVTMADLDTDARGWHVGYWVGRSLGIEESRLPDPFVDPSYAVVRSDWWTQDP